MRVLYVRKQRMHFYNSVRWNPYMYMKWLLNEKQKEDLEKKGYPGCLSFPDVLESLEGPWSLEYKNGGYVFWFGDPEIVCKAPEPIEAILPRVLGSSGMSKDISDIVGCSGDLDIDTFEKLWVEMSNPLFLGTGVSEREMVHDILGAFRKKLRCTVWSREDEIKKKLRYSKYLNMALAILAAVLLVIILFRG